MDRITLAMATQSEANNGSPAVLLVEDHPDIGEVTLRFLSMWKYDAQWARTFAEARQMAGSRRFDVVVSDLSLPDGNGLDLLRTIQATNPNVKGIALSGRATDEDRARSEAAGYATHLTKPIEMEKLRNVLRELAPSPHP